MAKLSTVFLTSDDGTAYRLLSFIFAAALLIGIGFQSVAATPVRCEGRMPILYEHASFGVPALPVSTRHQNGIYLSDEESFSDRVSAICIPTGYRVTLFEETHQQGRSITLKGPLERNLHPIGWGDRVSSVLVEQFGAPLSPATSPGTGRVTDTGAAESADAASGTVDDFTRLSIAYEAARNADSCNIVLDRYAEMVPLEDSRDRLSGGTVEIGGRQRIAMGTVGVLATAWRRQLVFKDQQRCFAPAALEIERQARVAMLQSTPCDAVLQTLDGLTSETTTARHVPNPWAAQVGSRDATSRDLALALSKQVRSVRPECTSGSY